MISRPAKLRREHYSLAIEQEQTAFVPFEDIEEAKNWLVRPLTTE